jgi:hypothetical protein
MPPPQPPLFPEAACTPAPDHLLLPASTKPSAHPPVFQSRHEKTKAATDNRDHFRFDQPSCLSSTLRTKITASSA